MRVEGYGQGREQPPYRRSEEALVRESHHEINTRHTDSEIGGGHRGRL